MCAEIINIGCGAKKDGTVNVDINFAVRPDVVCDGHFLPFKNEVFNECILRHVLEHTTKPDQLLNECYRILKIDGLFHVTFPNFASFTVLLEWLKKRPVYADDLIFGSKTERIQWQWQWHKWLCTTITVRSLLEHSGFTVQSIIGHSPNVSSKTAQMVGKFMVRLFPERAGNVTMMAKKR